MMGLVMAADEAEARGDPVAALEIIESHPWDENGRLFWRPWRVERLERLIRLEGMLPPWVVSRWILEQAMQAHQPSLLPARIRSLDHAIDLRGGLGALPGNDEIDARSRVMDNDWVYRQLYLYEFGALASYVRRYASGDLLAGADRIHEWSGAPMRALRFISREDKVLHWEDLGTGEPVETANLGAAAMVLPQECVLGRLVPSSLGPIFECVPLLVDESVADQVALDPSNWLEVLRDNGTGLEAGTGIVRGSHLFSDVPPTVWQFTILTYASPVERPTTADHLVDAVIDTVRAAMSGRLEQDVDDEGVDSWPCLAAALVHPFVLDRLPEVFGPDDALELNLLADRLFGPAADVCRWLGESARDVA